MDWRNHRAFNAAQARYDAMQPPEFYADDTDPPMSEDDALEEAEHQITCSPAAILWHLRELCQGKPAAMPVSVLFTRHFDPAEATADELLVVMLHGSAENCNAARIEMIDRLKESMQDDIKREALELLADDELAREQDPTPT